jgi:hypothetical protein
MPVPMTLSAPRPEPGIRKPEAPGCACPRCQSTYVRVCRARSVWERLIVESGMTIVRCRQCMIRFCQF